MKPRGPSGPKLPVQCDILQQGQGKKPLQLPLLQPLSCSPLV